MVNKINKFLFIVYILTLLFIPDYLMSEVIGKNLPINEVFLFILMIMFFVELLVSRAKREELLMLIRNKVFIYINILFLTVVLFMVISVVGTGDYKAWLQETIRFISVYFVVLYCMVDYKNLYESKKIINVILFGSGFVALLGLYQYFTERLILKNFIADYTFGVNVRVTSIFSNPNTFAAFIIILIFPLLMVAIYEKNLYKRIAYSVILVLLIVNLIMTFSRSAWIGLILGLTILTIVWNKKLLGVLVILLSIGVVASPIRSRFLDLFSKTVNDDRIKIWKTYIQMIKDHTLLGVGNGNGLNMYDYYIAKYPELMYNSHTRYPSHNSYLKVFSEIGIFGVIAFIAILVVVLIIINKYYNKVNDGFMKAVYIGLFASISSICFMNLYDNLFFVPKMIMIFWILVAIGMGNYLRLKKA